jgi:outer membrane protein
MFKKICTKWILLSCLAAGTLSAAERIGIVDFANCVAESKVGKEEQSNFDNMKQQLGAHLEQTEKELTGLASKLNDPDYMDGLSPEAEQDLKEKIHSLNDELSRYQNQYYQVLNQANMKVVQKLNAKVNEAAEQVAKDKKLNLVLHKDVCFFSASDLDITSSVVEKMDKAYEKEKK